MGELRVREEFKNLSEEEMSLIQNNQCILAIRTGVSLFEAKTICATYRDTL